MQDIFRTLSGFAKTLAILCLVLGVFLVIKEPSLENVAGFGGGAVIWGAIGWWLGKQAK